MLLAGVISRSTVSAEPSLILRICSVDRRKSLFLSVVFRPFVPYPHSLYSASAQLSAPTCQSGCPGNGFCFLFIKIILFTYVFVFDSAGSLLCRLFSNCGSWCLLSRCGFSCCRAWGFRACRLQYLWHMGSVIAAPGL